ncbi:hypothetical protein LTR66_013379, partial [Elasticomyces elasticus]
MNFHSSEKATRYLGLLDTARCNAQWQDVPELARKVEKHAPHRKCLTLTARSEAQLWTNISQRSTTTLSNANDGPFTISDLLQPLEKAVAESSNEEDSFQAKVCVDWMQCLIRPSNLALATEQRDIGKEWARFIGPRQGLMSYTWICGIKSRCIEGNAHEKIGQLYEARLAYQEALDWIDDAPSSVQNTHEYQHWAEMATAGYTTLVFRSVSTSSVEGLNETRAAFRAWAHRSKRSPFPMGLPASMPSSRDRMEVWKNYYDVLSIILHSDLCYSTLQAGNLLCLPDEPRSAEELVNARQEQRAELRHAQASFEALLIKASKFPKASQSNTNIEAWIESVIKNWRIFCGEGWSDEDLAPETKETVGRGVLDILYRAANLTFHSTPLLRHLFIVHASLGEFDLAMKAFNSYTEIIGKGKARAEKTGEHELGFDDDSIVLETAAEAIRLQCQYGGREEADRALQIGTQIIKWLEPNRPGSSSSRKADIHGGNQGTIDVVRPEALAAAYRAIGISQGTWARLTYDVASRSELQSSGIASLRKSLELMPDHSGTIESSYALALLLAETRDIAGSVAVLKSALKRQTRPTDGIDGVRNEYWTRERKLMPLWHLLALLLTSRGEYTTAVRTCEAAFEQFPDPGVLFSSPIGEHSRRNDKGVVDVMSSFEKEGIVQVKMTQISLIEAMEGPAIAVDSSDELLSLFRRLHGDLGAAKTYHRDFATATTANPQKSSGGTLKSLSGSLMRRSKTARQSIENSDMLSEPKRSVETRPSTSTAQTADAPTIHVTNEDGDLAEKQHHHHHHPRLPFKLRGHHGGDWKETVNSNLSKSNESRRQDEPFSEKPHFLPPGRLPLQSAETADLNVTNTPKAQQFSPIGYHSEHGEPPAPVGHSDQLSRQDIRLSTPSSSIALPGPHFPAAQDRRQKISLLVNIWLFVAGLYARASLHDDAQGAIDEAAKLVEGFELDIAGPNAQMSSTLAFEEKGWGGGKSVDTLWADVYSE